MSAYAFCIEAPRASCRLSWGSDVGDLFTLNGFDEPIRLSAPCFNQSVWLAGSYDVRLPESLMEVSGRRRPTKVSKRA